MSAAGQSFGIDSVLDAGWKSLEAGDFASALRAADASFDIDPLCPEAHTLIGSVRAAQGMVDDALDSFERSVEIDPGYVEPYLRATEVCLQLLGDSARALHYLEHAKEACIEADVMLDITLLELEAQLLSGNEADALARVDAIPNEVIESEPTIAFAVGRAYVELGKFTEARPLLERAISWNPENADLLYYLGLARQGTEDEAGAIAALLATRELDSNPERFPWSLNKRDFELEVRQALANLPAAVAAFVDGAVVLTHFLPPAELIVNGIDPRAPVVVELPPPSSEKPKVGQRQTPAVFVYQRNVERILGGTTDYSAPIRNAIVQDVRFQRPELRNIDFGPGSISPQASLIVAKSPHH